jgi:hypothetical protein
MMENCTRYQIEKAIKLAKEGTAAGIDECPNELWKALTKRFEKAQLMKRKGFDIVKALTYLYNDIQNHGIDDRPEFALGWMCPLYKKKDPTEIGNYRPITVLNMDYKIFTKVLALQILEPMDKMIHPDQAGFIPGQTIFNHIRLAKTILNYTEVVEEDGVIIALDQEKAYDRIHHKYLWEVQKAFGIPETFINTVKELYRTARTCVIINGVISKPFQVTRGVRACEARRPTVLPTLRLGDRTTGLSIQKRPRSTRPKHTRSPRKDNNQTIRRRHKPIPEQKGQS